ncbi:MAG: EamA family transporter, partial [Anaerovoracaceae bacterium]
LCTLVANVSYVKAANYISPTATSVLSSLEVVIACIAGILLFSEFMTPLQWVGAFIITFGAIGSQILPEKRPVSLKKNTN